MAVQYTGTHQVSLIDSTGAIIGSVANPLNIAGSIGAGATDKSPFTAGSTAGSVLMGVVTPSDTGVSADKLAVVALDVNRNLCVNLAAGSISGNAAAFAVGAGATSVSATGVRTGSGQQAVWGYDLDTDVGTEWGLGVNLRKRALGGSVEAGTLSDPLRVDPTGTTPQPVSASSLPLPTGAATLAKQPALGTAGSASSDVITIQGIASMTKLLVTPDANAAVNVAQVNGVTVLMGNGATGTGSQRVTVASDNTPFNVSASAETSQLFNGVTALTPKFATITASSSGATTIVALVSNKKIRVLSMNLVANAAVNVKWQSHVTPTDKTGLAYLAANGGYILPYSPLGWFETISGEALDINLSGAVAVGGHLTYVEV